MESRSRPSSAELLGLAQELFPMYQPTDMQFNIGRRAGEVARSLDIVLAPESHSKYRRVLITNHSAAESERLLKAKFGNMVVPKLTEELPNVNVYKLNRGTRPLINTLQTAPYGPAYMSRLAFLTGTFLRSLHDLDSGMFGLGPDNIAIGYAPEENNDDDITFTVVPPLAELGEVPAIRLEDIATEVVPRIQGYMHDAFLRGLDQGFSRRK